MKFNINKSKNIRSVYNWKEKRKTDGVVIKLYHHDLIGHCVIKENFIYSLVVNPKYRRKGFGKKIILFAEKIILRKYKEVKLIPQDNEDKLRQYYSNLGYVGLDCSNPDYEEEDKTWWVMTKRFL